MMWPWRLIKQASKDGKPPALRRSSPSNHPTAPGLEADSNTMANTLVDAFGTSQVPAEINAFIPPTGEVLVRVNRVDHTPTTHKTWKDGFNSVSALFKGRTVKPGKHTVDSGEWSMTIRISVREDGELKHVEATTYYFDHQNQLTRADTARNVKNYPLLASLSAGARFWGMDNMLKYLNYMQAKGPEIPVLEKFTQVVRPVRDYDQLSSLLKVMDDERIGLRKRNEE